MPITNFPDGASSYGIPVVGAGPIVPGGNTFFVGPSGGNGAGRGTKDEPWATLAYALTQCRASKNDVIFLLPGYVETIIAAGGQEINVAGVTIIGLGNDNNRPTFTFSTATTASFLISAANVQVSNIIGLAGIDGLTKPFHITGAGCTLDIEWQDASSTVEAATAVLTGTGADLLDLRLKYVGFPAGNATVSAVQLNGCNNGRVFVDFYGVVSTAVVEFITTLSNNIIVTGNVYTSGVTNQSRIVVDTITSSIWFTYGYDATADVAFIGGNVTGITVAPSISAVTDALYGASGISTWPAAAAYANGVSIAEVLAYIQDGVRRGSGTIMAANKSVADALGTDGSTVTDSAVTVIGPVGANNANNAFSSASVVANADGSVLERLEQLQSVQAEQLVSKAYADLTGYDTAAAFTVTGDVMVRVVGVVGAQEITSTSGTTVLSLGTTEAAQAIIANSTVDNTQFAATDVWVDTTPANDCEIMASAAWVIIGGGADIILTRSVDDITAGTLTLYCWWKPLSSGATVVAA